jgi:hypothetical protein
MEVSFCELIRETKNAINSRLDLLEVLVKNHTSSTKVSVPQQQHPDTVERLNNLESTLYRFNDLISNVIDKIHKMETRTYVPPIKSPSLYHEVIPTITIEDTNSEDSTKPILTIRSHHDDDNEDTYVEKTFNVDKNEVEEDEEEDEEEDGGEEEDEEEDGGEEDEKKEQEEEQEQEEEDGEEECIELEEFEYKGMTLYRDGESKVYSMDEDGALSEPIGVWDEVKQRIKKIL